jgi:hypothetical protein
VSAPTINSLQWYEAQWLDAREEVRLERAKTARLEGEILALQHQLKHERLEAERVAQIPRLELERDGLRAALDSLQTRADELRQLDAITEELHQTRSKLERVQRLPTRVGIWEGLAREFAESLEDFAPIYGALERDTDDEVILTVMAWHEQIEQTVAHGLTGNALTDETTHARRILIAQWVLLRWLEVAEVTRDR